MANVVVANSSAALDGDTLLTAEDAATVTGLHTFDRDPNPPFAVAASSAKVTNLDADMVDGFHAADLGGADVAGSETITGSWTFSTNPTFNANAIPETAIADGSVLARLAADESITGNWGIKAGASSVYAAIPGGAIYQKITTTGNVGTGEDTLWSQSVAASVLDTDGDELKVIAWGTKAGNSNAKTIKFKFGSTSITLVNAEQQPTNTSWRLEASIVRTGATSQLISAACSTGGGLRYNFNTTGSETLSGAVTVAITGEGTSNDDIVIQFGKIYYWPATL